MSSIKIPKVQFPTYETVLPWSGRTINYRPYSVSEERILMMAASGNQPDEINKSVIQIIENCCGVEVESLHPIDFEWCYIKLRIAAVSPILEVTYNLGCTETCPESIDINLNLEDVYVEGLNDLTEAGFVKKNGSWILMLNDEVGIQMNDMRESKEDVDLLHSSIKAIFDSDTVVSASELSKTEIEDFIDALPAPMADKISAFFDNQPYTSLDYKVVCPACKKVHTEKVSGIINFFG